MPIFVISLCFHRQDASVFATEKSLVVARHNLAFVESMFLFKKRNLACESLHKLLGRKNATADVHDFDNLSSSDDDEVENLLSKLLNMSKLGPFLLSILSSSPARGSSVWPITF